MKHVAGLCANVDILAGTPTFNEQDNIAFVAEQMDKGLTKYFKKYPSLIVDLDNGSTDKTREKFLEVKTKTNKLSLETEEGKIGKGHAFKMIFELAAQCKTKGVVVNDSDLKNINPTWVKNQINPIIKNKYDFVTPYYSRYKYDGTITNLICYPLVYGLFCYDIRQPIGGDYSFSYRLADHLMKVHWPKNAPLYGIDIFTTTHAILGNFKICQANLGAKIHRVKDPSKTLGPMYRQEVSTLFKIIIQNKDKLREIKKVRTAPILGRPENKKQPKKFDIDVEATKERFTKGFIESKKIMKKCLSEEDFSRIKSCYVHDKLHISDERWAKITYDYVLAYKKYESRSSSILKSFMPLWFGRIYTFINETKDMNTKQAEKLIKKQAQEFFILREYLLNKL